MTRRLSLRREDIYQDLFTENSDESDVASDDSSGAESSEKDDLPVETDIQDDLESSEEEENHLNVNSPKETQASLLTRSRTVDMLDLSSASMPPPRIPSPPPVSSFPATNFENPIIWGRAKKDPFK
jgi:hypothetical protein